jgi:carbonic anhydrase
MIKLVDLLLEEYPKGKYIPLEGEELNQAKQDLLCELNIIEQVSNVCSSTIVKKAWKSGADLTVHGWVYGINDGIIKDLDTSMSSTTQLEKR